MALFGNSSDDKPQGAINFPLMLGLSILAANQPRPYNQGPNTALGVIGKGGLNAAQMQAAAQKTAAATALAKQKQKSNDEYRKQQLEFARTRAENSTKRTALAEAADTRSQNEVRGIISGALTGYNIDKSGQVRDADSRIITIEQIRELVEKHNKGNNTLTRTYIPLEMIDDEGNPVHARFNIKTGELSERIGAGEWALARGQGLSREPGARARENLGFQRTKWATGLADKYGGEDAYEASRLYRQAAGADSNVGEGPGKTTRGIADLAIGAAFVDMMDANGRGSNRSYTERLDSLPGLAVQLYGALKRLFVEKKFTSPTHRQSILNLMEAYAGRAGMIASENAQRIKDQSGTAPVTGSTVAEPTSLDERLKAAKEKARANGIEID